MFVQRKVYMYKYWNPRLLEPTVPVKPPLSNEDTPTTWWRPHKVFLLGLLLGLMIN